MNQDKHEEHRRPGLEKLVAEMRARNPGWSVQRVISEAKAEWTARHYPVGPKPATGHRT